MEPCDPERWAVISEAPAYEVSTWGRVRRGDELVGTWTNKKGYELVSLEVAHVPSDSGEFPSEFSAASLTLLRYVHRLVLEAFVEPPSGRQANHDDGRKAHNALVNLAWTTPAGNVAHAWATGLQPRVRRRRPTCKYGHLRAQLVRYRRADGGLALSVRCARCRRVHARRTRSEAAGLRLLELFDP